MNYYTLDKDDDIIIDNVINSIIEEICNKKEIYFQIKIMKLSNDIDNKVKNQFNSFYKLNLIQKMIGTKFDKFIKKHLEFIINNIFIALRKKYIINVIDNTVHFEKNVELLNY